MADADPSFGAFVDKHVDDLFKTAVLVTWDDGEAEDLVQDCLMKMAKRWPRVRTMERPGGYARKTLLNLAFDETKRRARRRSELSLSGHSHADEVLEVGDIKATAALDSIAERAEMIEALGRLPRQQRLALVLRYFLDLSETQAAEMLGCSTGTVKSNTSRGLEHLREIFDPVPSRSEAFET
jgi:RNA polymerase sigma-70 factor (sigma-E family)